MITVNNQLHLSVIVNGNSVEGNDISFVDLLIHSNVRGLLPIMQLRFRDDYGSLKQRTNFIDGSQIVLKVGNSKKSIETYEFRMFNNKFDQYGATELHTISGYLDVPKYFIESSADVYEDTSSSVIQTIASNCSLEVDVETTSDKQVWFQANKRNGEFVKYLASHGKTSDTSGMQVAVRRDKKLIYRDMNKPRKEQAVFTYVPSNEEPLSVQVMAHRKISKSGQANQNYGYQHRLISQDGSKELESPILKEVDLYPRGQYAQINTNVKSDVQRGKVDFSPLHYNDNTHEEYFQAKYRNQRVGNLNSQMMEVFCYVQTKLDLLDFVRIELNNPKTKKDEANSGLYYVSAKDVICKGTGYAEKFLLARAGTN